MRKELQTLAPLAILLFALGLSGCSDTPTGIDPQRRVIAPGGGPAVPGVPVSRPGAAARDTIKIASFNIQVFGTSKLKKTEVMDVLCKVIRRFDVVAIQELRSTDDNIMPRFVEMINASGSHYDFVVGPRLGRTTSKEQYSFVFNTDSIGVDRRSVYTVADPRDLLHREPLVARFQVQGAPAGQGFSFSLVNIHTDPDETRTELDALADVFAGVQNNGSGEDDVILLGDLNVDDKHLGRLGQLPGIGHAITGMMTNTRKNKMYDNIVFHRAATAEYTGRFGVVDLMAEFNLSQAEALQVSDHMPIWAEFKSLEAAGR